MSNGSLRIKRGYSDGGAFLTRENPKNDGEAEESGVLRLCLVVCSLMMSMRVEHKIGGFTQNKFFQTGEKKW
jgi:hypothetical protein